MSHSPDDMASDLRRILAPRPKPTVEDVAEVRHRFEEARNSREVFVPLSLRRRVADAIENARPGYSDQMLASARAEAAIDALRPFMAALLADSPDQALLSPSDDGDSLENGGR